MYFLKWYKNQCAIGETEEVVDDVDQDIDKTSQNCVITLNNKHLKFIRAKGNYNRPRRNVQFIYTNIFETELPFFYHILRTGSTLAILGYLRGGSVLSPISACTYTIYNIPLFST